MIDTYPQELTGAEGEKSAAKWGEEQRSRIGLGLLSIGDAVIVTDARGDIILLNPAAESLTGWTDLEARDRPIEAIFRIIHEVTRLPVIQPVKEVIAHGVVRNLDHLTLLISKDGTERAIDDSASPIHDDLGDLDGVVLIFRDVSENRRYQKGVEEARRHGEVIIAAVQDSLVVLDSDLTVRSANRAYYEIFRTSPEDTISRSIFALGDGLWDLAGLRVLLQSILSRAVPAGEVQVERDFPTIGPRVMLINARLLRGKDGREEMILLAIEDTTRRRRLEDSLAASELQYRRLFEAAKDGILILDAVSGIITDVNPFLLELLGFPYEGIVGKQLWEIGLLADEEESRAYLKELQEKGYLRYEDLPLATSDGRTVEVEVVSNVYPAGDAMIIQCNIRDITERKRAEADLRRAKELAEEAGKAKDLFLSTLSHELRTPLTPVLATVALLETMADLPERLKVEIASIRRNVEIEARLIDDLLDVTRIGQGKLDLHLEIHDAHVAIRSALELCQAEIEAKKLEVTLSLRADDHLVWADPRRLQQVFWNLIKNAVKFTPAGGSIRVRSADAGAGRLSIEVTDTGEGISPEYLPHIFDAFDQGNRKTTRRFGGLGLGLSIAKILMDLQGGSLTAASPGPGLGSTFRVELEQIEREVEEATDSEPVARPGVPPLKLLLVEDNPDTLRAISLLLRSGGYSVKTAASVEEAMTALSAGGFNLLISDIGLPDGSGLDIMRHCRDTFGLKGIAFSGYATKEDVRESKAAGFSHHLSKPSSLNVLVEHIRQTVG